MTTICYHQNHYAALLDRAVVPGCHWLDIGAGVRIHGGWGGTPQADLAARAARFAGCDPHGAHLNANPFLTERHVGAADQLPFPDQSFDLVTANMVLEHLEHPARVFREVARVLKPGGCFIFLTPNRTHPVVRLAHWTLHSRLRTLLARLIERRQGEHVFPTRYRANTPGDVTRACRDTGLEPVKLERFASFPFTMRYPILRDLERAMIHVAPERWRSNLLGVLVRLPEAAPVALARSA